MTKKPKRPRDANQLAKFIIDAATGEVELPESKTDTTKNPAAVALGRLGGMPSSGRAREVLELLNLNIDGLSRVQLRKLTGRDAHDVNAPIDRGVKRKDMERTAEDVFRITEQGKEYLKRSAPYTGELKIVLWEDAAQLSVKEVTATSLPSETVAATVSN